ncbi:hypothetical protein PBI_THONKO_49 [Mycobacterium phage Thonko]|uniref:Exonuclease n=1 Tax=Mycobacterium phage Thonko TaxID=2282910 RepID=A0A346FC96_9CAUD|nr:exonuclease [Mycobacterium phage Thonko]AXN53321.1 hypothetical protein PBI_THONKO_49 [Mycobacterium phage Thonko]
MTSVAHLFPARRQPDGRVYRRPVDHDGKLGDGWTDSTEHAHPDYFAPDAPEPLETVAVSVKSCTVEDTDAVGTLTNTSAPNTNTEGHMTALPDVDTTRRTEFAGYPLPPAPHRPGVEFNGRQQYRLPSPTTGRPTAFSRATTVAKTLDDQSGLEKWRRRMIVARVLDLFDRAEDGDEQARKLLNGLRDTYRTATKVTPIDEALDYIDNSMGGADARELGTCVHAWAEALDCGLVLLRDVPEVVRPHIDAYRAVLARFGLVAVPEYVERVVLNDQGEESVAGQIDRIFRVVATGELVLGDVKTSTSLDYSWLPFGVQVGGVYGWATKMLGLDGKTWEPMPEIRRDFAILMHIPSDQPERAQAITINLWWGGEVLVESIAARQRRREAKVEVPKFAIPSPTDPALRYAAARLALSAITSDADGQAVYEEYQDVWDDDLTDFATSVAGLL